MKFEMLSLVVPGTTCMARCPFCVSCNSNDAAEGEVDFRNFEKVINLAKQSGITTAMITGYGEPLLQAGSIFDYLRRLDDLASKDKSDLTFIELQTNAVDMMLRHDIYVSALETWKHEGMTHICISMISLNNEISHMNYMPNSQVKYDLEPVIEMIHEAGLTVRLTAIGANEYGYINTPETLEDFLVFAKMNGVSQTTYRPLNMEYRRKSTRDWCESHKLTKEQKSMMWDYLNKTSIVVNNLPKIGTVFDHNGQNIMFSLPMDKYTKTVDDKSARNLIYFPDGSVRYAWEQEGAVLLK